MSMQLKTALRSLPTNLLLIYIKSIIVLELSCGSVNASSIVMSLKEQVIKKICYSLKVALIYLDEHGTYRMKSSSMIKVLQFIR